MNLHKSSSKKTYVTFLASSCLFVVSALIVSLAKPALALDNTAQPHNQYENGFWNTWGDGNAELNGYSLLYPRYGEIRKGTAVTIFVTEDFSNSKRVKADPGKNPKEDVSPVMKLNLVQDFPTGLYDYNMMLSSFISTQPFAGQEVGKPLKTSFSSQEWCGHVYHQRIFNKNDISFNVHSYFDGEADQRGKVEFQKEGFSEDVLLLWARGLASPFMKPGEKRKVNYLTSMETSRLKHTSPKWLEAELAVSHDIKEVKVAGETYKVREYTAMPSSGAQWKVEVSTEPPYKIIRWSNSEGLKAELLGSKRMKYWQLNNNGSEALLKELGL